MDKTPAERLKRRVEREILFSLHDYIIGMIPEPVRKIVGWILLIFGAVVLLRVYPGSLFFELADQMFMITFFVGMFSFAYGIILLRHKG
tara:strand:- start:60 stop:326 length:267 start_codon:yes stop_codon:yes gene_type:complete